MSTIQTILRIRLWQLYRLLKDIGPILLLLVSPILFVGLMGVLDVVSKNSFPVVGSLIVFFLLSFHWQRKDASFLKQLSVPPSLIYGVEYSAGMLPFSLLFVLAVGDWKNAAIMQIGAFLLSFLSPPTKSSTQRKSFMLRWFPLAAFEWRCGLRQYWWFVGIIYLLGLLLAKYVAAVIIIVILLAYSAASAFNHLEGKELIEQPYYQYAFLRWKIWTQYRVFSLCLLPHYLLFLIFHLQYWYLLLVAIGAAYLLFGICVFYKYANFSPGRQVVNLQMILAISAGALFTPLMPVFLPGLLIYFFILWRRASKNLEYYYAQN